MCTHTHTHTHTHTLTGEIATFLNVTLDDVSRGKDSAALGSSNGSSDTGGEGAAKRAGRNAWRL